MKTTIIGNLTKVEPIQAKETYSSQSIEVTVQEYDHNSGALKEPQIFPITIFNKKIAELNATSLLGQRVLAQCWLKSIKKEKDDKLFYNIALNCTSLLKSN